MGMSLPLVLEDVVRSFRAPIPVSVLSQSDSGYLGLEKGRHQVQRTGY